MARPSNAPQHQMKMGFILFIFLELLFCISHWLLSLIFWKIQKVESWYYLATPHPAIEYRCSQHCLPNNAPQHQTKMGFILSGSHYYCCKHWKLMSSQWYMAIAEFLQIKKISRNIRVVVLLRILNKKLSALSSLRKIISVQCPLILPYICSYTENRSLHKL